MVTLPMTLGMGPRPIPQICLKSAAYHATAAAAAADARSVHTLTNIFKLWFSWLRVMILRKSVNMRVLIVNNLCSLPCTLVSGSPELPYLPYFLKTDNYDLFILSREKQFLDIDGVRKFLLPVS